MSREVHFKHKTMCVKYLVDLWNEIMTWCHTTIAAPTLLSATFNPPDIDLIWVDNANNNTCFNIWRSTDGTNFVLIDTIGDLENYTDTTAVPGVEYWYKVQACNASGDTSDFSNTVDTDTLFAEVHYGLLYNYYAVSAGLLAPTGWHVPTEAEFNTLITTLGGLAGLSEKLREVGLTYWNAPNAGATNSSGLNGRGAGHRIWNTGIFDAINVTCNWLTTTAPFGVVHLEFEVHNTEQLVQFYKTEGVSVICIKNDATDPGVIVDYDGNAYPTVKIGTQVWTTRNLIVKHYNDGTPIPEVTDSATWSGLGTGAWCYYNNDPTNM
jgi:uncharacterized protein (TIGR02145 family)